MKTTTVIFQEYNSCSFKRPATYCVRVATGDFLYIHSRERAKAEQWAKEEFGGKYRLRVG